MKNTDFTWLQRTGVVLTGIALTCAGLGMGVSPALTQPEPAEVAVKTAPKGGDVMAEAIAKLQQSQKRWIEVNLATQRLIAWEGKKPVRAVIVSTGKASTPTRTGIFAINTKIRSARMQGDDYDVPDVPFTMFYSGGYAIHGAYWHNRFGTPVSHGCVNVAVDHAGWLFKWASVGTPVVVHR
ncbi:L,D-transpeptidase [Kovacikia minuta CCNUW1]|uniref:L,D-transpeptidase n=1 Tax=Kovacikia minuta TaxID=2931930 RepID=UPI001CCD3A0A|nr:L,D-transpeptidase [Kovacikia minuta]UBF23613.1 L,D-transpeptidase [Kovacikia minuta CCNUW1]